MKTKTIYILVLTFLMVACSQAPQDNNMTTSQSDAQPALTGQSGVVDETSDPDIVKVAISSPEHKTLVAAVQAAELVDVLSNAGPFTVFAPTDEAFGKLPEGTVEGLLKPEKKAALQNILEYHTYVGNLKVDYMSDGQKYEQVNGGYITISKNGNEVIVNGNAKVIGTVQTSNGLIHVVDNVLLPE